MCGIVGAAGHLLARDLTIFKQLLAADTFRGVHSTGVANIPINKKMEPDIGKACVEGWEATNYKPIDSVIRTTAHALIGHNRHATRGGVNRANAHPFFVEDQIVGCHNGTLDLHGSGKFMDDVHDFGTDSEAALTAIARMGAKEALESFIGAWAFVWYDYESNTLNFTRNSQRPLTLAYKPDTFSELFWASERKMLEWILDRNNALSGMEFYKIPECTVLSFKMPDRSTGLFEDPDEWTYTEKKSASRWTGISGSRTAGGTRIMTPGQPKLIGGTSGSGPTETIEDLIKHRELRTIRSYLKPKWGEGVDWKWITDKGYQLTTSEARASYAKDECCAMCGSSIDPEEKWRALQNKVMICEDCIEDDLTAEMIYEGGMRT